MSIFRTEEPGNDPQAKRVIIAHLSDKIAQVEQFPLETGQGRKAVTKKPEKQD